MALFKHFSSTLQLKGKIVSVDTYPNSIKINYDIILLDIEPIYKYIDEKDIVEIDMFLIPLINSITLNYKVEVLI